MIRGDGFLNVAGLFQAFGQIVIKRSLIGSDDDSAAEIIDGIVRLLVEVRGDAGEAEDIGVIRHGCEIALAYGQGLPVFFAL